MVLAMQMRRWTDQGIPVLDYVAATSVGVVGGMPMLDLAYGEDSRADVDATSSDRRRTVHRGAGHRGREPSSARHSTI
jgi:hypothetical protein